MPWSPGRRHAPMRWHEPRPTVSLSAVLPGRLACVLGIASLCGVAACGEGSVPSPFAQPDSGAADAGQDAEPPADVESDADPTIGGPCLDDSQCNDAIECTTDACDPELARCRFTPVHELCADDIHCDGSEVCDPKLGCREGDPVACSDESTCTIDACVEATKSCTHVPRDADGDGDPDKNCGGGDCNDDNALISSQAAEVCANALDDDCDGQTDEAGCETPAHDTCAEALEITGSGSHNLSLAAAQSNYAASCVPGGGSWRDIVVAIIVPPGGAVDVDVIAEAPYGLLALAAAEQCGDATSELSCHEGASSPKSSLVSRLRLRSLPPGAYPVYLFGSGPDVLLSVEFLPPTLPPANETCGTATPLAGGAHETAVVIGVATDLASDCSSTTGELVWELDLASPQDVDVYATSLDGWGIPSVSLRTATCTAQADELACKSSQPAHVYSRALPAGTYRVAVAASAPTEVDFVVELSPPTTPPADETCAAAPALSPGVTTPVSLDDHTDDVKLGCVAGAPDAAYALDLAQASDVLLVGRLSNGDEAGVLLSKPACALPADLLACGKSDRSPTRAAAHGVPAGSYRAVIESLLGNPTELTAFVRPQAPAVVVPFADTCAQAIAIPATGGRFVGNTANAGADYDAGCDLGGQAAGGAPEQMLRLSLAAKKRVVFDMKGSAYNTLLDVRKGPGCPGTEIVGACAAGYVADKSFLDLVLDPGEYFVQIDGYGGAKGAWTLDVFVADP